MKANRVVNDSNVLISAALSEWVSIANAKLGRRDPDGAEEHSTDVHRGSVREEPRLHLGAKRSVQRGGLFDPGRHHRVREHCLENPGLPMDESFDIEAYVAETAALLGIPLTEAAEAGVVVNLRRTAEAAQLVLEFEVPPELDPAPVFKA